MKKTVVVIVGPTAVGKTRLSIEIAKRFNGEVISGDSMQVYKGLDIGTAKVTDQEKQDIPHYMLDMKEPWEAFSVADFQAHAKAYIQKIQQNDQLPIIAGGSGLYIQAILYNYNFSETKRDDNLVKELEEVIEKEGPLALHQQLEQIDPVQAKKIHPNNHRRVIRALEIYKTTGLTMTEYQREQGESDYRPILIGLEMERTMLYDRINSRIDNMIKHGLIEEVKSLFDQGLENTQAMKAIGYKEFIPYFKGEQSLSDSIELLKRNSRRYAKRQYTWFKNKMDVNWYSITPEAINENIQIILRDLAGKLKDL